MIRGFIHNVSTRQIGGYFVNEIRGFVHKIPTGYLVRYIVNEIGEFIYNVPTGYWGGYFLEEPTICPVGICWANCFKTHNELTLYPLGKHPFAPSVVDQLCHYSKGKGKEREIVIKMEEEEEGLEYASNGKYKTVPSMSGVVVRELIPIKQDLESREVIQEVKESCGCSLEEHPIVISNNKVNVAKNVIHIHIQVECLLPEDHVVSDQHDI